MEFLSKIELKELLIFTSLNLIYCLLSVFKDILRQRGTRNQSAWMSTFTYATYILVIKRITNSSTEVAIIGTMISNFLGDYLGRWIIEYFIPRQVICYRYTICKDRSDIENIIDFLENNDLGYKYENAHSRHKEYLSFQVYTKDKEEDKLVENMLNEHNIIHYNRGESRNKGNINLGQKQNENNSQ